MKRCFVGTWIFPGLVLMPKGLGLSLGRNGEMEETDVLPWQCREQLPWAQASFSASFQPTQSPRQGQSALQARSPSDPIDPRQWGGTG